MVRNNMNFKVPYNYLPLQFSEHEIFFDLWKPVLDSGEFTLGPFVENYEKRFAKYMGSDYCIAVNNGTDALILALRALGIGQGDEVITPCNSFYATTGAIVAVGATPIFADVDSRYQISISEINDLISARTKAILPVHWGGASPEMNKIRNIADDHELFIIEDACMAIGGNIMGRSPGSFSEIAAFSMHPLKTLNVAGDGGMVTTNSEELYVWMKKYRNHGMVNRDIIEFWGVNMRIQPIQAVLANYFIDEVDNYVKLRNLNANFLDNGLRNLKEYVSIPERPSGYLETFSLYMILVKERDALLNFLIDNGIEAKVHYPVPLHLQPAAEKLGLRTRNLMIAESQAKSLLTLPVHQYLIEDQLIYMIKKIEEFYS
jgi:aminotransferase EvaB